LGFYITKAQSYYKAAELYRKACDMGDTYGCYNLGVLYENGQGVRQSHAKAAKLYKKSCDMRLELGCKNYARLNK